MQSGTLEVPAPPPSTRRQTSFRLWLKPCQGSTLDDIGQELSFNLFGPPGVQKVTDCESKHARGPLYVVGARELGFGVAELDTTTWNAAALIEEVWELVATYLLCVF